MSEIVNHLLHQQSSHCETGVVANMLSSKGFAMSEPMAFGLASALTFAYLPFVKIGGLPLIAYRMPPKTIIKSVAKKLNIELISRKFSSPKKGMQALDQALAEGHIVGLQTSVYWLPYFPEDMRFHFNAHNLTVYGKNEQGDYLISDPVFEEVVTCSPESLERARFAKGALAPKGLMYILGEVPENIDLAPQIYKSIKKTAKMMNGIPLPGIPFFGVKGIHYLAKKITELEKKPSKYARLYLGHIVRMQEEIGTGGAGFRFIFASFLDESSKLTGDAELFELSQFTTEIGDQWRTFAVQAVLFCKDRKSISLQDISDVLIKCAEMEKQLQSRLLSLSAFK
ncbi:BtrH N-terminal domain-containing protein [uncultured Paraglaciecola sp.]|uniref:BtrH N-terminal domain-containing protein n=1 Tax=uncultured Paraglaciecola sp. TaxID=1765024 RepID=UPI0030D9DB03|tara:strand:+ start:22541 stop:23560 length:1020 start_codon:yes stop_codon:yes gene_type:complete